MASLPDTSCPSTVSIGSTRPTIQDKTKSNPMRINIAMNKPMRLAISRFSGGSLSTKIEIKIILSIPSTNSKAVRVAKAIQASGEVIRSILCLTQKRYVLACNAAMRSSRGGWLANSLPRSPVMPIAETLAGRVPACI